MKRMYATRIVIILFISLFTVMITACQPTPEEPVVVNKNDGKLEEAMYQPPALAAPYEAPPHWSETVKGDKLDIVIDTDITVPEVDKYPVVKLEPAIFTQQRVNELVDYFARGKKLYLPYAKTKADYEEEIIEAKRGSQVDGKYVVTEDSLAWVKELEEKQKAAPDESPKVYTDTTLTYDKDYETRADIIASGKNFLSVIVENGDGSEAAIGFNNYTAGYRSNTGFYYQSYKNGGYITESQYKMTIEDETLAADWAGTGELLSKITITQEQAEAKAQSVIDDLGIKDMMLEKAEKAVSPDAPDKGAYQLRYMRQSGGIPVYMFDGFGWSDGEDPPAYTQPFREECLIMIVTEDGVEGFSWGGCANTIETVNENVTLLPFDKVQQTIKDQIFYKKSFETGSYGMKDNKVIVTSAELRMGYIGVKDNPGQALIVPVWVFETDASHFNTTMGEEQRWSDNVYMLNAIDGGVIEPSRIDLDHC